MYKEMSAFSLLMFFRENRYLAYNLLRFSSFECLILQGVSDM